MPFSLFKMFVHKEWQMKREQALAEEVTTVVQCHYISLVMCFIGCWLVNAFLSAHLKSDQSVC